MIVIIASNKIALIQQIKDTLQHEFDMSNKGEIHLYTFGNANIRN
jgi:hypothetical protein